jgi:hypothetical protein
MIEPGPRLMGRCRLFRIESIIAVFEPIAVPQRLLTGCQQRTRKEIDMMLNKIALFAVALSFAIASSGGAEAARLKMRTASPPPQGMSDLKAKPRVVRDKYCKDNSPNHVPCDWVFENYCKLLGGTMSGRQGWGGKTCWTPS